MENKLLSICIPTYNRADKLDEMLDNLIEKIEPYNLPIYISDNCSKDNTYEIVSKYKKKYDHIYYSKNNNNFGPDKNFELVLKMSETEYSWLFGDDDLIVNDDLGKLIEDLNTGYDLIVVNFPSKDNLVCSKIYNDKNVLLKEMSPHMTYMTSLIYSKKIIQNSEFKRFYDSNFIQMGVLFYYFGFQNFEVKFIHDIIVKDLPNRNSGWNDKVFQYFAIKFPTLIINLPDSYTYKSKIKACRNMIKKLGFLNMTINARIYNEVNLHDIYINYNTLKYSFNFLGIIWLYLLSFIPKSFLHHLKKRIKDIIK